MAKVDLEQIAKEYVKKEWDFIPNDYPYPSDESGDDLWQSYNDHLAGIRKGLEIAIARVREVQGEIGDLRVEWLGNYFENVITGEADLPDKILDGGEGEE